MAGLKPHSTVAGRGVELLSHFVARVRRASRSRASLFTDVFYFCLRVTAEIKQGRKALCTQWRGSFLGLAAVLRK